MEVDSWFIAYFGDFIEDLKNMIDHTHGRPVCSFLSILSAVWTRVCPSHST